MSAEFINLFVRGCWLYSSISVRCHWRANKRQQFLSVFMSYSLKRAIMCVYICVVVCYVNKVVNSLLITSILMYLNTEHSVMVTGFVMLFYAVNEGNSEC